MASVEGLTLPVPTGGYDSDSAPEAMPASRAPVVQNFLVDRPGALPIRGPLIDVTPYYASTAGPKPVGVWSFNDSLLIGMRDQDGTAVRDPWVAPYRRAASTGALSNAATTAYHVDLETNTVSSVTVNQSQAPGPRYARIGGYVYGLSFGSEVGSVSENGGHLAYTQIARWDGSTTAPTVYANAPEGAQDVISHYERLFVLGGRNPSGSGTIRQNTLWFSDPIANAALTDATTSWQDDDSGLTNQIELDADDADDFGVAMAKVGEHLAIFKRRSIHLLLGSGSDTWSVRTFTRSVGCVDARSIVEYEGGCFFASARGYMWFDGSSLTPVANHQRVDQLTEVLEAVGDQGVDGGYCTASILPNGYIQLSAGVAASDVGAVAAPTYSAMLHVPTGGWSHFRSEAFEGEMPLHGLRTTSHYVLLDETLAAKADTVTKPELSQSTGNLGLDSGGAPLWFWTGTPTFSGTGDTLTNGDGVEMFPAGDGQVVIEAKVWWNLVSGAFPFFKQQFARLIVDYNFQVADDEDDDLNSGWYVTVTDANGTTLVDEFQLPSQGDPTVTAWPYRRRYRQDAFMEADEVQVRIEWRGTDLLPLYKADLQQVHLAFQPTRQRRSD